MRRKVVHTSDAADVNITPLLDIVFILLIFFIVTATFLREKGIDVNTPQDCGEDCPVGGEVLILAIQEDGFIRVNRTRTIDVGSVKPVVQEFVARNENGVVLVSAAPNSESGIAVHVMDQSIDGGARAVTLSLQKSDDA